MPRESRGQAAADEYQIGASSDTWPGTVDINTSTGKITGDIGASDADTGTFVLTIQAHNTNGWSEELYFTISVRLIVSIALPIKLQDCATYPVAESSGTTEYALSLSQTASNFFPIQAGTGLSINSSGVLEQIIVTDTDVTSVDNGMLLLTDTTEDFAILVPVTFT